MNTARPRPRRWPTFADGLRSVALTARLGRLLGLAFAVCFVTGMISHYHYHPWSWLPVPAEPVWLYRVTQGVHVLTGTASLPLLLVKLWSVYPALFVWPPVRSARHAAERLSVLVLVAASLVELVTGFLNVLDWYPWPWPFVAVHRFLAYIVVGSVLLHLAVKLPLVLAGLRTPLRDEVPTPDEVTPVSALSRRGLLLATGAGIGTVLATTAGQTVTPLSGIGLLATRQASRAPQRVPVNKTAAQARVAAAATSPRWRLTVVGDRTLVLALADLDALARHEADLPIACVEGWSVGARWRGVRLLDLVRRVGGNASSRVRVVSLEPHGAYRTSEVAGPQVRAALLATHLHGQRIDLDHGYPVRLIAPDRPGVLNTKWLSRIEVT